MKRITARLLAFLPVVLLGAVVASAQLPTGTILGTVKDASGAIVPGADVSARETQTNQTRAGKSGADGGYRFDALPVGVYELTIQASGFQKIVQSGLTLEVGQQLVSDFTLQVGSTSQTVEVSAAAVSLVDTTSSSLGSVVNQEQITDLPLNGRNYNDLTLLQTGVIKTLNSNISQIGFNGTSYSSNGAPQRSNMYLLDGDILVNLAGNNGSSALGTTLGVDGIQEYKVITNNFDAEYGMVMGSVETVVSKSGTNSFHGDVFDFIRNSVLDARNYFDLPSARLPNGHRNPEFRRNQFGGALGGPIRKDKTFFFATYEGLRATLYTTNTTTTTGSIAATTAINPTPCHGPAGTVFQGSNSAGANYCPQLATIAGSPTPTLAPQMAPFINTYPAPNLPGTANNYGFNFNQTTPENYGQIRIDNVISDKDTVFGRYTFDKSQLPFVGSFNMSYTLENSQNQFFTVAENHIFSSTLLNTARVSFTREPLLYGLIATNPLFSTPAFQLLPNSINLFGSMSATGIGAIGTSGVAPRFETENIFSGSDDVNYNRGRHSIKFGAIFNHYQYYGAQHGVDRGSLTFQNLATFIAGTTLTTFNINVPGADNVTRYFNFSTMGFYIQDSWKVFPRLTLNYGMRYEPETTVNEIHGNYGSLLNWPASPVFTLQHAAFSNPSLRNWSPRFGFAYDVFGNGKTAVRGGFDVLYDLSTFGTSVINEGGFGPPLSQNISTTTYSVTHPIVTIPVQYPAPNTFQVSMRGVNPYQESQPHLLAYNFSVQQQLPARMALTVAYAGSHGIDITQSNEGNNVLPSGVPGLDAKGNPACIEVHPGTALNNASQFDGSATSCYAINTTTNPQCWPAQGLASSNNFAQPKVPGVNPNGLDCFDRQNSNNLSMAFVSNTGESFYNALNVTLNKNVSQGLQFQLAYTWSKTSDAMQGSTAVDTGDIVREPLHPLSDYGPSTFDVRNNFHFNAQYHLPNFVSAESFVGKFVDGWALNGILSLQSGYPFNVFNATDRAGIAYLPGYSNRGEPDLVPGRNNNNTTHGLSSGTCPSLAGGLPLGGHPNSPSTPAGSPPRFWFDPCAFTLQPAGFIGTAPRNFLRGPGLANVDFSIVKDIAIHKLGEAGKLQFRAETFDLFNHPNFSLPNGTISTGACAPGTADALTGCNFALSGGGGTITSTVGNSAALPGGDRQIQFGLKLIF